MIVKGFVNNMEQWMNACDMIITKAGPGTIAEAYICGLPVLLNAFVPCQEEGNIEYVVRNQTGIFSKDPHTIAATVEVGSSNTGSTPDRISRQGLAPDLGWSRPRKTKACQSPWSLRLNVWLHVCVMTCPRRIHTWTACSQAWTGPDQAAFSAMAARAKALGKPDALFRIVRDLAQLSKQTTAVSERRQAVPALVH